MSDLRRSQLALCAAGAVLVVALGAWQLARGREPASAPEKAVPIEVAPAGGAGRGGARVVVHVAGAVRAPGVYRLPASARVDDAVARAGGASRGADLSGLNLAAELEDGRQVLVPKRAPAAAAGAGVAAAPVPEGQPLNLNTATLEQLDELDGIGPATAEKILALRQEQGGFGSVEELADVPGIGEKRLAALREAVTV